jgi:hypothetical protein
MLREILPGHSCSRHALVPAMQLMMFSALPLQHECNIMATSEHKKTVYLAPRPALRIAIILFLSSFSLNSLAVGLLPLCFARAADGLSNL